MCCLHAFGLLEFEWAGHFPLSSIWHQDPAKYGTNGTPKDGMGTGHDAIEIHWVDPTLTISRFLRWFRSHLWASWKGPSPVLRLMPSAGCSLSPTFSSLPGGLKCDLAFEKLGTNGRIGLVDSEFARNVGSKLKSPKPCSLKKCLSFAMVERPWLMGHNQESMESDFKALSPCRTPPPGWVSGMDPIATEVKVIKHNSTSRTKSTSILLWYSEAVYGSGNIVWTRGKDRYFSWSCVLDIGLKIG